MVARNCRWIDDGSVDGVNVADSVDGCEMIKLESLVQAGAESKWLRQPYVEGLAVHAKDKYAQARCCVMVFPKCVRIEFCFG